LVSDRTEHQCHAGSGEVYSWDSIFRFLGV